MIEGMTVGSREANNAGDVRNNCSIREDELSLKSSKKNCESFSDTLQERVSNSSEWRLTVWE